MKNIITFILLVLFVGMPLVGIEVIGHSVEGRPITAHRFGPQSSETALVLIGGIHGLYEGNTVELMTEFISYFEMNQPHSAVYIIENMNPDSFYVQTNRSNDHPTGWVNGRRVGAAWTRFNINYVDLNRNWDTVSWSSDVRYHAGDRRVGAGGSGPMSEPEVRYVGQFLVEKNAQYNNMLVVNYHSYVFMQTTMGMAQPSYTGHWQNPTVNAFADRFALLYSRTAGNYEYLQKWTRYEVPGEFLHWAGDNGISAIDIELPNENAVRTVNSWGKTHYEQNLSAVLAILNNL